MEVSELTLWAARLGVLALMYIFLLALMLMLRADLRATDRPRVQARPKQPRKPAPIPTPAPKPTVPEAPKVPHVPSVLVTGGVMPPEGKEFRLAETMDIGRAPSCAISIPSNFVSSHHARITGRDNEWIIEDLGSTNGTLLNGKPLTAPQTLSTGDVIIIGDTKIVVK